jgi:hypothetical protein
MVTPSTSSKRHGKPVVRKGPLCIGVVLLFAVPLAVISVLNTRSEHKSHGLDRLEELVESRHWRPPQQRLILAESKHAKCIRLKNNLDVVLEEADTIQVIVVDREERWWFLEVDDDDKTKHNLDLVSGYYLPAEDKAPWYGAQRLVKEDLGIIAPLSALRTSVDGMQDGQVPSSASDQWSFLGRTPVQKGGGFVYSYLLSYQDVAVSASQAISLEKSKVYEALLKNRFSDIKAFASIALSMAHFEDKERSKRTVVT